MCMGGNSAPAAPKPPPLAPPPEPPPKAPPPVLPPKEVIPEDYTPEVKVAKSKKENSNTIGRGTSQLKISNINSGSAKGGLNV
jgi:hypothetical protein